MWLTILLPWCLFAQWPSRPVPGEPRTADGKVNLNGPVPKAADGHPDLSGVWDRGVPPGAPPPPGNVPPFPFAGGPPPGAPPQGLAPGGPPAGGPAAAKPRPQRPFQDLPSLFADGLPMQPWAAELRRQRLAENSKDHPDAHCLPLHPVQLHAHPQPRKIVQAPGVVILMYEANNGLRQIFTDGRALPKLEDLQPWWFGYSVGRWEGDTLVVDSIGFRDNSWIDEEGTPMSSEGHLTERFRRLNYGTLEIEIRINDPKTFTKPWSYKLQQRLMPDTELIEFICLENNSSVSHLVGK
jgi:hypothetical protein